MKYKTWLALIISVSLCAACAVGPDYIRPTLETPSAFQENWKTAQPRDQELTGNWWESFNDPLLNTLVTQVDLSNQNLAQAEAKFRQAKALVQGTRAGYFPTVAAAASATRSGTSRNRNSNAVNTSGGDTNNSFSLSLNASWEPDLWGRVQRNVEANQANAQASAADLQAIRLSAKAELVQNYLQVRVLDAQKTLLEDTVAGYTKSFQLTQNQYAAGVVSKADVIQAQTQLKSTQTQALDIGVQRAQLVHAIALLIGQPASTFSIAQTPLITAVPPSIPVGIPSILLERRPDISAAERRVAAANAQIGVVKAAYFPALTLSASAGFLSSEVANWLTLPSRVWSLGPTLAQALFDGGARRAQTDQAIAAYDASAAAYKQTVLTAFQEVEDNLAALHILEQEAQVQNDTVQSARLALTLILNQYRAGLVNYTNVATVQATVLNSERTALDILGRRLSASVLLIKALGGGWDQDQFEKP